MPQRRSVGSQAKLASQSVFQNDRSQFDVRGWNGHAWQKRWSHGNRDSIARHIDPDRFFGGDRGDKQWIDVLQEYLA